MTDTPEPEKAPAKKPKPSAAKKRASGGRTTPKKIDADRFIAEILDGRHAGRLVDLIEAVHKQLTDGATQKRYRVTYTYDGAERTFTEDDLTIGQVRAAEIVSGKPAGLMNPQVSAADIQALIAGHIVTEVDTDVEIRAAASWAGTLNYHDAMTALTYYEVEAVPKG